GGRSARFHRTIGGFRGNEARGACRARPHGPSVAQRLPPVRCAQPVGREYGKVHLRRNQIGTGSEGGSARGRGQTLGNRHGKRHLPRKVSRPRFAAVVPQPGRAALAPAPDSRFSPSTASPAQAASVGRGTRPPTPPSSSVSALLPAAAPGSPCTARPDTN